jgi:hypothetical protein
MVYINKNTDLEQALIQGFNTLGPGNAIPNKVYGIIPNPSPRIRSGGVFTQGLYGLVSANAGTILQVVLENQTYLNAATLMNQMSFINKYLIFREELPNDNDIASNQNNNTVFIHKQACDLFDIYGPQIVAPVPVPIPAPIPAPVLINRCNRTALNTYIFDPLNQAVVGNPIQGNLRVHLNAIGTPVDFGIIRGSKKINYLENNLIIYDQLRGAAAVPVNTALENSGRFDAYFFNGIISIDGRVLPAGNDFRQNFCPQNNPFNMTNLGQIQNLFNTVYTPLRIAGVKVQDIAQTIRAVTNPVITTHARKISANLFSVPTINPNEYNQYYCIFSEDRALPNNAAILNNLQVVNAGRKVRHDILRNLNTPNLIFNHKEDPYSSTAITTYYHHILNTFETMYQYERINGFNSIVW